MPHEVATVATGERTMTTPEQRRRRIARVRARQHPDAPLGGFRGRILRDCTIDADGNVTRPHKHPLDRPGAYTG